MLEKPQGLSLVRRDKLHCYDLVCRCSGVQQGHDSIQNQLSIQIFLNFDTEIVLSVFIFWQISQLQQSSVCATCFFFFLSFMESVSIRKLHQPIT